MNTKISILLAGALLTTSLYAQESKDYYTTLKVSKTDLKYNNMQFENPRITGFDRGNGDQSQNVLSVSVGRELGQMPIRVELEYGKIKEETFTSYWKPFTTTSQKITTKADYLMASALYDYKTNFATLFAGAGLGVAQVESDAVQGVSSNFSSQTNTNLAYSVVAGASKPINKTMDIELSYRYMDLGKADTGINEFGLRDEQFKGDLVASQISLGLRIKF